MARKRRGAAARGASAGATNGGPSQQTLLDFKDKGQKDSWSDLEGLTAASQVIQHHVSSIYRQDATRHWLCPNKVVVCVTSMETSASSELEQAQTEQALAAVPPSNGVGKDEIVISDEESSFPSMGVPRHACSKLRCRQNPNCLNYMNLDAWDRPETKEKFVDDEMKKLNLTWTRSMLDMAPCAARGLVNFGSTCYCSTLLQVWFYDLSFRNQVYVLASESELLEHLARVFSNLQLGIEPVYRPQELLEFLQIERHLQQDVQEFSKLMLQCIDEKCKAFCSTDLIGGSCAYVTTCNECHGESVTEGTFHEITLTPKANATVDEMFQEALKPEVMSESNQVTCQRCQAKRDATRSMRLKKIGPTLCLHVMRFVYDQRTKSKRKIPASISVSETLDVPDHGRFVLTGVIFHKGRSTEHGHYFAHVRDVVEKRWLQLDDTSATVLSDVKTPIVSTEAYLLYYTRVSFIDHPQPSIDPPQRLQLEVEDQNAEYKANVCHIKERVHEMENKFQQMRYSLLGLHPYLLLKRVEDPCIYLPTEFLQTVFSVENTGTPPLDYDGLVCQHGKLDPMKMGQVKRVTVEGAAALLNYCGLRVEPLDSATKQCIDCIKGYLQSRLADRERKVSYEVFEKLLGTFPTTRSSTSTVIDLTDSTLLNARSPGYIQPCWVGRAWLTEVRKSRRLTNPSAGKSDLYCRHGDLLPNAQKRTLISGEAFAMLMATFPDFCCPSVTMSVCLDCKKELDEAQMINSQFREAARKEKEKFSCLAAPAWTESESTSSEEPAVGYVVNGDFLRAWRKWVDDPVEASRPFAIDNSELLCNTHGKLIFDPNSMLERSLSLLAVVPVETWIALMDDHSCTIPILSDTAVCNVCRQDTLLKLDPEIESCVEVQAQGMRKRRRPVELLIHLAETVRHAKLALMEQVNAMPIEQTLVLEGRELCDDDATMLDIGAYADCTFKLTLAGRPADEDEDMEITSANEPEVGFSGLLGRSSRAAGRSGSERSSTEALDYEDSEVLCLSESDGASSRLTSIPCRHCTFLNSPKLQDCAMCQKPI